MFFLAFKYKIKFLNQNSSLMIKVWSQLELGLQIKYCKHVFLYDFFGFFNNKYNIIWWGGWENQLLSQLYKTSECWQNNTGHGKIIIMLLKCCEGFSFCCKTYLDTLIKPNRRFFSIFKTNMANAMPHDTESGICYLNQASTNNVMI